VEVSMSAIPVTSFDRNFLRSLKITVPEDFADDVQLLCNVRETVDVIRDQEREIQTLKRKLSDMRKTINALRRRE
jgi:hypothetical protein